MNIFVLDLDIKKCAKYHCDRHVVKMLLEGVQILCAVCAKSGIKTAYKSTHHNYPCVLWAGKSIQNWQWLRKLVVSLNIEYKYRYYKTINHKSFAVAIKLTEPRIPNLGLTAFCQAMPKEFRVLDDPVTAYRRYYFKNKKKIATWTRRRVPLWFRGMGKVISSLDNEILK